MGEGVDARRMQEWVRRAGGVARASSLIEAGWSRWRVQRAVESGVLARPRQGWVAAPGADPHLVEAAGSGLLVGCVTQAARLGLWSLEASDRHFAVAAPGGTIRAPHASILHYQRPVAPRERFSVVDRIENVLDQVARCLPLEQAVTVWDSALNRGLVELHELARLGYTGRAREVLALADPYADSGLESLMRLRLRRLPARVRSQAWIAGHQVDFLIGQRLVVQVDGAQHAGQQRAVDTRHDARLRLRGYTVLRFTYAQVVHECTETHELIMRAVAQGLHV